MRRLIALLVAGTPLVAAPAAPPTAPRPAVRELRVGPVAETSTGMELVFAGPSAPCGQRLTGRLSVAGSGGLSVSRTVTKHPDGGCSIRFEMPFSAIGPDVLAKASLPAIGWSLAGEVSENGTTRAVTWAGSVPREAVRLTEPIEPVIRRFVTVKDIQMGSMGVATSTVSVEVELRNPLSFDLQLADAAYELTLDGEPLARGRKEAMIVRAARPSRIELPVELSNSGILSGLWKAATGERLEGVLVGVARLRVPGGEMNLPFSIPVTLSWK